MDLLKTYENYCHLQQPRTKIEKRTPQPNFQNLTTQSASIILPDQKLNTSLIQSVQTTSSLCCNTTYMILLPSINLPKVLNDLFRPVKNLATRAIGLFDRTKRKSQGVHIILKHFSNHNRSLSVRKNKDGYRFKLIKQQNVSQFATSRPFLSHAIELDNG